MGMSTINASLFAGMFLAGAHRLEQKKEWINELNVFPVPDGDTGTNMTMTIMSAVKEINALEQPDMARLAKAVSSGSLRGARGNSGVILSQLLRGFCKGIRDFDDIDTFVICSAFSKATETAYKAVMKPKEGTILTVARGFSEEASRLLDEDPSIEMEDLLGKSLERAKQVLDMTPEMLPVLKEAGVVDSGGQGLIQILSGAYDKYLGLEEPEEESGETVKEPEIPVYCVECIVRTNEPVSDEDELFYRNLLRGNGDDVVTALQGSAIRFHIHTTQPGAVITLSSGWGLLSKVKVQSLQEGHKETLITQADRERMAAQERREKAADTPRKDVGFISVCAGEGMGSIFKDLGVTRLIEGGQTMNPSTEDLLNAIEEVNADTVFVFPNNKNIILAASQAQKLAEGCRVIVIPTKTVPQGIAAMIGYNPQISAQENEKLMYEEISAVKTCQLTYAVRDTHIDDKEIHEGDYMGVGDKGILAVGSDLTQTAVAAVREMLGEDSELVSIYYGEDVTEEDAQALRDVIQENCPDCEVELNQGGQPVYYYIISVE